MSLDTQKGFDWEDEWADMTGGSKTPGSGNQWHSKLDVKDIKFLWSCKATDQKSYPLLSWIREAFELAGQENREAGLAVKDGDKKYVVIDAEVFVNLLKQDFKLFPVSKVEAKLERSKIPELLRDE